jgi:N-acetylneuraminic acid mutarotase
MSGYLIGGTSNGIPTNEFWEFNPDDEQPWKQWTKIRPVPAKRTQSSAVYAALNSGLPFIYLFGGLDEDKQPCNDLYVFDINVSLWDKLTPSINPSPRYASALGYLDFVYNIGGILRDANGKDSITDQVHRLLQYSTAWKEVTKFPEAQCNSLVFSVDDSIIYAGLGQTSLNDSPAFSKRLFVSKNITEEGIEWDDRLPSMPGSPGSKALGGAVIGTNIYVVDDGGYIHIFDMQNEKWSEKSETRRLPVKNRKIHCVYGFAGDGKLYIGLGEDSREIISYDPGWDTDN